MFAHYSLKKEINLFGLNLKLTLWVDCQNKECDLWVMVDGRIMPKDYGLPRYHEIDTPEKAQAWFRRIDLDMLAYRYCEERKARSRASLSSGRAVA